MLEASVLSHGLFVGVPATVHEVLLELEHFGTRGVVVVVVEPLDDLEGPSPLEHVATDDIAPERHGFLAVTELRESPGALLEEMVGAADELVERIEVTARSLDVLQPLGGLADRVDGC